MNTTGFYREVRRFCADCEQCIHKDGKMYCDQFEDEELVEMTKDSYCFWYEWVEREAYEKEIPRWY